VNDDRQHRAFLSAIHESPEDDAPRLVYADWLTDHGGEPGQARAEFIRAGCRLARLAPDDPQRPALAEREAELLAAHQAEWTDLVFADWLAHRPRSCRNPQGHEFCKIVRQGVLAHVERDRLAEGDPRRTALAATLEALGKRMEDEFHFLPGTCDVPLFDEVTFRRGFVEAATAYPFVVEFFAEALPVVAPVLRSLEIDSDGDESADEALSRLPSVLGKLALTRLDCHCPVQEYDALRFLLAASALRRLTKLHLWCEDPDWGAEDGDEWVRLLAGSKNLSGLRDLYLEHSRTFTDDAFVTVLDSRRLAGLEKCWLRPNEAMPLSAEVVRRFAARFGPQIESDATVLPES
jgi:uncharacterized protein (TIGR02996 family)